MLPENQLILQKAVKKIIGIVFYGNVWFRGCTQISLKSHNSGFTCRGQKRFSQFYSSSKALSDDISKILTALFLKFNKSGKIYHCWILQMFIYRFKKKQQRKKANFNCK